MKITDFIFSFIYDRMTVSVGICRVRVFINSNSEIYTVLSDLDENPTASVTNANEVIVEQLRECAKIPANSKIIEHYQSTWLSRSSFDLMTYDEKGLPSWQSISSAKIYDLLECDKTEFNDYKKDDRVMKEIYNAVNGVPITKRFEYAEPREITERRLEIEANKCSKSDFQRLLDTYPSERELGELLKKDLSLLGELYALDNEDYICFYEFPIGEGRVDFAVFTGCSWLTVYLIEIKGAKKTLRRKDHYQNFMSFVTQGREQLMQRAAVISGNYEHYRRQMHSILKEVKAKNEPYHAFRGPKYDLPVDPNKDVNFNYVLIAGRTNDDVNDSRKRHFEDDQSRIKIQTETWDSWLNKVKRDR